MKAFKWPILKQNPSIFGWNMTQTPLAIHFKDRYDPKTLHSSLTWKKSTLRFKSRLMEQTEIIIHSHEGSPSHNLVQVWSLCVLIEIIHYHLKIWFKFVGTDWNYSSFILKEIHLNNWLQIKGAHWNNSSLTWR